MNCPHCNAPLPAEARFCPACGRAGTQGLVGEAKPSRRWPFFLVIGCAAALALLFFAGIVAAIAIPNLLNAIDRGKQKRTMADLRSVGTALEEYSTQHEVYPVADDIEALRKELVPEYIAVLPLLDGWGRPFRVSSDGTVYELTSTGKDGVAQGCAGGTTTDFDEDICFANGEFTQWPEGQQR